MLFHSIDYFSCYFLFLELLRITNNVPNNGTHGLLDEILFNINPFKSSLPDTSLRPVQYVAISYFNKKFLISENAIQ